MLRSGLNTGEWGGLASTLDCTAGGSPVGTVGLFTCSDIGRMKGVEDVAEEVCSVWLSTYGVSVGEGQSREEDEI